MISVCQYLYMPFTYIQLGMKLPFPPKKASKSIHVGMKLCFTISQSNPSTNMFLSNQILLNTVTVAQRQSCTNTACCPRKAWEGTPATGKADRNPCEPRAHTVLCYESKPACIPRWWFQIFFMFTPKIGEDSHFDSYFFWDGLKPPTRYCLAIFCYDPR